MTSHITYRQEVYRKLIHLSSLWMVAAIYVLDRPWALLLFGILGVGVLCLERVRRLDHPAGRILNRFFLNMMRAEERESTYRPTGAFFVLAGAFVSTLAFGQAVAMTALAMMLTGDIVAALVGRRFGRIRIMDKSLEGTAAFFVTAFLFAVLISALVPVPDHFFRASAAGALAGAIAELFAKKIKIDDNLVVPLAAGVVMSILV